MKICAQRKAGRTKRARRLCRSFILLPMDTCVSSPATRMSLACRARPCTKNEAPEEEAVFFFPLNNLFTGGGCCFTKSSLGTHLKYFDLSCTENSTASPCPQDTSGRYSKALSKHTAWTHARSDRSTSKQGWLFFLLFQNRVWQFSLKGSRDI